MAGGAHSEIQTLVVLVNFFLGTVVVNFFKLREKVSALPDVSGDDVFKGVPCDSKVQRSRSKRITLTSLVELMSGGADMHDAGAKPDMVMCDAETQTVMPV